MYLDMVLTLIAWLSPRSKEANIFLAPLFRRNIFAFWSVGMLIKTIAILGIMSLFKVLPNIGLLLMCLLGGGGFAVCAMNLMMVLQRSHRSRTGTGTDRNSDILLRPDAMPIPVMVVPRKVRLPIDAD